MASAVAGAMFLIAAVAALTVKGGLHTVPEGHVGVYYRGGALLNVTTPPGFHWMWPILDHMHAVQTTLQTDKVTEIPCGTKGGSMISFEKVEVVNRLRPQLVLETLRMYGVNYDKLWVYDKIHHEINQYCSSHSLQEVYIDEFSDIDEMLKARLSTDLLVYAPGLEIVAVRVTKPRISPEIMKNYEDLEKERTKVLVFTERQRVVEKEAETNRKRAVIEAEMAAQTSAILSEQRLKERQMMQRIEQTENEMSVARSKARADAEFYASSREAEANELRLTPAYLELAFLQALGNSTKIYFGEKLPSIMIDQRLLPTVSELRGHVDGAQKVCDAPK